MATPGSSFTPTPLGDEDNLGVRYRANTLQCYWDETVLRPLSKSRIVSGTETTLIRKEDTGPLMRCPL
ncbi:hypothetical protein TNCV_5069551 [Trichonephila clavipes]|nr:hypothetical protein TNCV_5069551 [Trichonephila clavipes]